jgi:hypothetical protein
MGHPWAIYSMHEPGWVKNFLRKNHEWAGSKFGNPCMHVGTLNLLGFVSVLGLRSFGL